MALYQQCVLKHASEITVFAMLRHRVTKQYVGYAKFESRSKDALVFVCKGDQPLPSVTTARNHFIEEVDISWLRDVCFKKEVDMKSNIDVVLATLAVNSQALGNK